MPHHTPPRPRSRTNAALRAYARLVDAYLGSSPAHDSTAWLSIAFDLAAAADHYHGHLVPGYRPGLGGSRAALDELGRNYGGCVRQWLRRQSASTLAAACALAYAYGTACEGRREHIA